MQDFLITLAECSVSMSVPVLLYIAFMPLLSKRYKAKWLYYAWLVIVIGLIIPFRFHPDTALIKTDAVHFVVQQFGPGNIGNAGNITADPAVIKANTVHRGLSDIPWYKIGSFLWMAGVLVFLAYHGLRHYHFIRLVNRWSEKVSDSQVHETLQKIKDEMGISKQIRLQACSCVSSPMMIGFINPVILLPRADFFADKSLFVLRHELVHWKRKDLWYKALVLLATAIHWFNPIVYLMAKAIAAQCEISCDAEVVKNTDMKGRRQYSETILNAIQSGLKIQTALSTNYYGGKKAMKQRFENIFDYRRKKRGTTVVALVLLVMLLSSVLVACQAKVGADPAAPTQTANTADAGDMAQKLASTATAWCDAVKSGDDKAQYDLLTKALQGKIGDGYDSLAWLSGNPSVTIEGYTYSEILGGIRVTFDYEAQGAAEKWNQYLTFKEEDGQLKIDSVTDLASVSHAWARAVKDRDGKAQYDLMTKALQEKMYDNLEGLNWVTGTSSPWVKEYTFSDNGDGGIRVIFSYESSAGPAGRYYQDIIFNEEDGQLKIDSISDPVRLPNE